MFRSKVRRCWSNSCLCVHSVFTCPYLNVCFIPSSLFQKFDYTKRKQTLVIGHFRVPPGLCIKMRLMCSTFDVEMIFYSHANKTYFYKKGCALQSEHFWNSEVAYFNHIFTGNGYSVSRKDILVFHHSLLMFCQFVPCFAARLAQLEERRSAEREVVSSNPGRTINQGL